MIQCPPVSKKHLVLTEKCLQFFTGRKKERKQERERERERQRDREKREREDSQLQQQLYVK